MSIIATFILELPLKTEKYQEDILAKRFEIGRNIYNACLNELQTRHTTMIQSKEYQEIIKQIKATFRIQEKQQHLQKNTAKINHSLKEKRKPLWHLKNKLHEKYGLTELSSPPICCVHVYTLQYTSRFINCPKNCQSSLAIHGETLIWKQ